MAGTIPRDDMTSFEAVTWFFDQAAERVRCDDEMRELLRHPWRELTVSVPIRLDNGKLKLFTGYRVQHNGARGPYKGGIRYHPRTGLDEVRALASLMTWKNLSLKKRWDIISLIETMELGLDLFGRRLELIWVF